MSARSAERAPPLLAEPLVACDTPQLNESTSIHFSCLPSVDSDSIPSIFKKASYAIFANSSSPLCGPGYSEFTEPRPNAPSGGQAERARSSLLRRRREICHQPQRDIELLELEVWTQVGHRLVTAGPRLVVDHVHAGLPQGVSGFRLLTRVVVDRHVLRDPAVQEVLAIRA